MSAFTNARALAREAATDDEPFELFRGFGEVFIALGVGLLGAGLWGMSFLSSAGVLIFGLIGAATAWGLAEHLTRRRRMMLPSILLALGWVFSLEMIVVYLLTTYADNIEFAIVAIPVSAGLAALVFYARFLLPFSLAIIAGSALAAVLTIVNLLDPGSNLQFAEFGPAAFFDITQSTSIGVALLIFGIATFCVAMRYDLADPYRMGRKSTCAFWLHMIAAPAIVNTVLLTLYNLGSAFGVIALLAMVAVLSVVALVIDRRSFLVSALIYVGLLLFLAADALEGAAAPLAMLVLGVFVVTLGAGWTRARSWLMHVLPLGKFKFNLPPAASV